MTWLWSIELHRKLLSDGIRNRAFMKAFQKVIRPGQSTVTDIGSGTGFLSFLASRAGAKHVNLYEHDTEIIDLSELIARNNQIHNLTFHKHSSHAAKKSEIQKTDIVVTETLGSHALEENLIENMRDAKRFLKPPQKDKNGQLISGILIPGKLFQYIAPVSGVTCFQQLNTTWDQLPLQFQVDLNPAKRISLSNMFQKLVPPTDIWKGEKSVVCCDEIDFYSLESKKKDSFRHNFARWNVDKPVDIFGFCLWWKVELVPGVELSTSPFEKTTHWEQVYLPLMEPLECEENDEINVTLQNDLTNYHDIGLDFRWQVKLKRGGDVKSLYESQPIVNI